jgi:inosine triphosphate pyrophosphatase
MKIITLVTGNAGKLKEWQRLFPKDIKLVNQDIDLDEIQSLDLEAIITDKVRRAYEIVGDPVIVEDISAGLYELKGMPGPFIKYFEQTLGPDALFKLASKDGVPAIVTAMIAYYDGVETIVVRADVAGKVVKPRGTNGFGFDIVFMPEGSDKTYAEMTATEKDAVSHRSKALKALVAQLKAKD